MPKSEKLENFCVFFVFFIDFFVNLILFDFAEVATLAEDFFGAIGGESCGNFRSALVAGASEEATGVSEFHPLGVATIRTKSRNRHSHFSVKFEFSTHESVVFRTFLASQNLLQNLVAHLLDRIWDQIPPPLTKGGRGGFHIARRIRRGRSFSQRFNISPPLELEIQPRSRKKIQALA